MMKAILPREIIEQKILLIRGEKVILDLDLAALYGTTTKALNQAVKRNRDRFPDDFMFQLSPDEKREVVTICDHLSRLKYSPVHPYAFTEHGVIMVASVLNTKRAIDASVYVVRTFVRLRKMLASNKELAHKLAELERRVESHDGAIRSLVAAIRELMAQPEPKEKIGFVKERRAVYKTQRRVNSGRDIMIKVIAIIVAPDGEQENRREIAINEKNEINKLPLRDYPITRDTNNGRGVTLKHKNDECKASFHRYEMNAYIGSASRRLRDNKLTEMFRRFLENAGIAEKGTSVELEFANDTVSIMKL